MTLLAELQRRNVIRVAVAYIVAGWLLIQVLEVATGVFAAPDWVMKTIISAVLIGIVPVLIFSWVYEMTPAGIKRESEIPQADSITAHTARKLDIAVIVLLFPVMGMMVWQHLREDPPEAVEVGPSSAPEAGTQGPESASVAVLPFVNMSSDPENEYFADGLSEELLNQLTQIPDLMVAGRTSSFSFKGKNQDLRSIGSALGVGNVLEGSVRRSGDQVRVTAQLVRVSDGFHLWSNTYDRLMEDVFSIQDDIAENVAAAMKIVLDEPARQRMLSAGVRDVEAFIAYQKGVELFREAHGTAPLFETLEKGLVYFDEAITRLPEFGAAYWQKADYYAHLLIEFRTDPARREQALEDHRKTLENAYRFSDDNRRAYVDVDRVLFSDDWTSLPDRIERALASEECPDPTWIQMAIILGYAKPMGEMWARYLLCEPLAIQGAIEVGTAAALLGDPDAAIELYRRARAEFGANPWLMGNTQRVLMGQGRFDEALALAPDVIEDRDWYGWGAEALPLAAAGRLEEARKALDRWIEARGPVESLDVLAALGDRDAANRLASDIDARPAGPFLLLLQLYTCWCGAAFDLDAAPRLKARLAQAGLDWPPPTLIKYPAKDW